MYEKRTQHTCKMGGMITRYIIVHMSCRGLRGWVGSIPDRYTSMVCIKQNSQCADEANDVPEMWLQMLPPNCFSMMMAKLIRAQTARLGTNSVQDTIQDLRREVRSALPTELLVQNDTIVEFNEPVTRVTMLQLVAYEDFWSSIRHRVGRREPQWNALRLSENANSVVLARFDDANPESDAMELMDEAARAERLERLAREEKQDLARALAEEAAARVAEDMGHIRYGMRSEQETSHGGRRATRSRKPYRRRTVRRRRRKFRRL